jgi:hypothetical protein
VTAASTTHERSNDMAKHRKRFYVGVPNASIGHGQRQVFSLKFTPTADLFGFRYSRVLGPFRAFAGADLARRSPHLTAGMTVRQIEKVAAKVERRLRAA